LAAAAAGQELPKKERGLANLLQKKFRQALTFLRCLMRSVPSPNILADLLFRHVTFGLLSLKDPGRGNPAEKPSKLRLVKYVFQTKKRNTIQRLGPLRLLFDMACRRGIFDK
jgi:hypothetical protein